MNYRKKTSRFPASNSINFEELDIVLFKSTLLALFVPTAFAFIDSMEMPQSASHMY